MDELTLLLGAAVAVTALVAATIGGITGMSTGILMLPVLIFAFGVREAIPIVTVAMLFNTASRAVANREFTDYRVVRWYSLGAVPAAVLGGVAFANAPADILARLLGAFLLVLVAWRHLPLGGGRPMPLRGFVPVGVAQGFLSALFGGAGPFGAHFFLAYGLTRGAFVGTVAVGTFLVNVAKAGVYGGFTLLDGEALLIAVGIGLIMAVGAYLGAKIVRRVSQAAFTYIVEGIMALSGIVLVVQG